MAHLVGQLREKTVFVKYVFCKRARQPAGRCSVRVSSVSKRLAFGGASVISTWERVRRLHEMGFTHVINLRSSRRYRTKLRSFHSLWLPFPDDKKERPAWFYRRAFRFYEHARNGGDGKVLVICHHGICRSASMAYFLLRASGITSTRAEKAVLRVRPCAIICRAYRECGEAFLSKGRR